GNNPSELVFAPAYLFDLGLKQGVAIQIEFSPDPAGVFQNFRCVGVFLLWNVPGLLKQRQIDIRLDIALRARITVPVPGAAEVAALLDDADAIYARLAQTRSRQQTTEAAPDDQNIDILAQGLAGKAGRDIGIVNITA